MKEKRGRYSYLHPEREKYISGRSLGTNFDKDYLLNLFEANALAAEQEEKQRQTMPDYHADPIAILFIRSELRLVVDLQNCIKAQQSKAYAQKVKISNLQQMAKIVAYIQENGFDTRENLQTTYDSITLQMHDARQKTKDTETQIISEVSLWDGLFSFQGSCEGFRVVLSSLESEKGHFARCVQKIF